MLLALGEGSWFRYTPRYLEALGAGALVIGLWGTLTDFLDAAWQFPGGALVDRVGRRRALLLLTAASAPGLVLLWIPSWPWVLAGTVLYMASAAYAQPATFALLGELLPRDRRASGFVLQSIVKRVPLLIAPPAAGLLITAHLGILAGVRAALVVALALTLAALVLQAGFRRPAALPSSGPALAFRPRGLPPPLRRLLVSDILVRAGESTMKVFLPLWVVHEAGFTDFAFGLGLAVMAAASLASYGPARLADSGARKPWVAFSFLLFALFPLAVVGARTPALLGAAFAVGGLREMGEPARKASIVDLARAEHAGRTVGTYYATRGLAIMPAALVGAWLWTMNPVAPFLAGAALCAAGLVHYWLTVPAE